MYTVTFKFQKLILKLKKIKLFFFYSFCVTLSLHAKIKDCRSNRVACGQYKDKDKVHQTEFLSFHMLLIHTPIKNVLN